MLVSIEQHVDFIANVIEYMRGNNLANATDCQAQRSGWSVNDLASGDIVKTAPTCNSWYLGANIPGKSRVFMPYVGGVGRYRAECDEVVAAGYRGFVCVAGGVAAHPMAHGREAPLLPSHGISCEIRGRNRRACFTVIGGRVVVLGVAATR